MKTGVFYILLIIMKKINKSKIKIFGHGLLTGLILQCASIGPVSLYIFNLTIEKTLLDGLIAASAVTLVDCSYITLTVLGLGKLLENKKIKKSLGIISSTILILLGVIAIHSSFSENGSIEILDSTSDLLYSFTSTLLLTTFNPLTIIFYMGVFSAKAIEYDYPRKELLIFGLSVGSATFVFLGLLVILLSVIKGVIPFLAIFILKIIIGCLLIAYGFVRLKATALLRN
ncbi:hypothetical protein CO057_03990 [Candidatus Uhrbacteria bacterium CG_4_9_14_0_2_um_filter_41_50]|uniref:Lysine transporter LysE n=1 Tax=Candidatus Uhrbacteria bacterium CG_4_9_14_0_2_um_filter_41_50 TaxID=1975031 RepID=A0A2M8ENA7_9BACT|nr:MAG: hypothetical protein COZ45_04060 [Candidatus Uhrbacteria bacterium CG_4_10_14_3_um_filter_41_21]PIZ54269.1 MAG: hypothetical protein COY24_04385 [Candidatus Uhrbacteria bacterium CG_4_10_14_0_2_um_filter_41_21]PJB84786.1 MAG: hypothetical protein CO086_01760 [Candidatus Uhrbacteria bacterium CG_4_9_14_0_8_um_filter_41_16]PJC24219.1 MAG: hypothetical protein CO057_03990 [Candidatus Uhrbacteria bacterium CG_4_9_14_0_2_um_filter_41_50]PJE74661.1 MAG: hypothetical protein COV03_04320 [Candi